MNTHLSISFHFLLLTCICIFNCLQSATIPPSSLKQNAPTPCVIVIFGATGDLTAKKLLPALYNLAKDGLLSENTVIVGFARRNLTHDDFRQEMASAINTFSRTNPFDQALWNKFEKNIFYHQSEFDLSAGYANLQQRLSEIDQKFGTQGNRLYFLATQPSYFPEIITQLHSNSLIYDINDSKWSRVIVEKPFGANLESAWVLQKHISNHLNDNQVYRIDHYLGKEGVQNLLTLRFENRLFEPLWNKNHIDNVQITLSEDIGIGTRGTFWEETGALRDLLQNHLMQLLTIVAMEPPLNSSAESIHEEKIKLLNSIRPFPSNEIDRFVVRGQYGPGFINGTPVVGYRQEKSVSETSNMETYVAATLFIDNERWKDIPFYLRAGKRLPKQVTEIVITFKAQPGKTANVLHIRIQPNMGVFLKVLAKAPGLLNDTIAPVNIGYSSEAHFGMSIPEAYEKLFYDSIRGDDSLFVKANEQLLAWQLLTPVLQHWQSLSSSNFPDYQAGTWGPGKADEMLQRNGHKWDLLENKN